jgi:hypothetical protein
MRRRPDLDLARKQIDISRFLEFVSISHPGIFAEPAKRPAERNMKIERERIHAIQDVIVGRSVSGEKVRRHWIGRVAAHVLRCHPKESLYHVHVVFS